jgi:hypothetical protein
MTDKYIKDGQVAILYSPGYGAGWSTWGVPELAYDKDLVEAYIKDDTEGLIAMAKIKYPDEYLGGADDVKIVWVSQGSTYRINEYDGSESIEYGYSGYTTA